MSEPVLDEDALLLDSQPQVRPPTTRSESSRTESVNSATQRDLVDTFDLFKNYFDRKLVDLKSDILSEQDSLTRKFREEADLKFKSEGNRIQFRFNESIAEGLTKIHRHLVSVNSPVTSTAADLLIKLKDRNKLIRIADNSAGGWATVREYEASDIADNEEDEKRIRSAESRALRKDKFRDRRPPYPPRPSTSSFPAATAPAPSPVTQQPFRYSGARRGPCPMDICHQCKQYGHWRRNCPLNAKLPLPDTQPATSK